MFGALSAEEVEEFLKQELVGRIGCHYDDTTYIVPISYIYEDNCITAHTTEGMKVDIMRANPSVCFEVEHIETLGNWKSVITWGTFKEIKDNEERKKAVKKLYKRVFPAVVSEKVKLNNRWPFEPGDDEYIPGVLFNIHLYKKTGRFELSDAITF